MHSELHISLPGSGRRTTRLGFGGSSLMGSAGLRASLKILGVAYDAGVRHFDVAPAYGFGDAEACLGEFLSTRPEATVTTKFGIAPGRRRALRQGAQRLAGPVLKQLPALRRRVAQTISSAPAPRDPLTVAEANQSLAASLRALRRDFIDVLLVHEADVADCTDEMLRFLEDAVRSGRVGAFGIGSDPDRANRIQQQRAAFAGVVQREWSMFEAADSSSSASFRIHHRALTSRFVELHQRLTAQRSEAAEWSAAAGVEVLQPGMLAALMVRGALVCNADAMLLVSSKNDAHVRRNVAAAADRTLDEACLRLHTWLRHMGKASV